MGTSKTRRQKQNWVGDYINTVWKGKRKEIDIDKLCNEFAFKFATSKKTGLEIIHILEHQMMFKIEGNKILK